MRSLSVKSEQNPVIQCRKDTENMKYYQEGRSFRQHEPPSDPGRPIQPYRWVLYSKVTSSTSASHTKFPILSMQFCTR